MQSHTYKSQFTTKFELSQAKISKTHKNSSEFTVIYVHGLYSDPWGRKGIEISRFCEENNLDCMRFELAGHGSDIANYEKADFDVWKNQVLEVIDDLVKGQVLLLGSSVGGWLSLIAAIERPERVRGIIGLAAAPDFTADLENYIFTAEQKQAMEKDGRLTFPTKDFTYVFTKKMFDTAQKNLLLTGVIPITCPVHLLQGSKDDSLDPNKAFNIFKALQTDEVIVKWIKGSNHRLGRDVDIEEIHNSIKSFISKID